jgi:aerobic-type carbon monoxide dehydrogenase small subunit (CoxS/CutS family)
MAHKTIDLSFALNGKPQTVKVPAGITALELLRQILNHRGTKEGCGIGECGACTIQVDGKAVNACLMLAAQLDGRDVCTVEGLGDGEHLHPIQQAFINHHAVQCGFCTPGLLMSTKALMEEDAQPDRNAIVKAVSGNLCRCTGYHQILSAIEEAVAQRPKGDE